MRKLSDIMIELASQILAQPLDATSEQGLCCALLLAYVAWNRANGRANGDRGGRYLQGLAQLERDNPRARAELVSYDCEAMIELLVEFKQKNHADDKRVIVGCETTPARTVHVDWTHEPSEKRVERAKPRGPRGRG